MSRVLVGVSAENMFDAIRTRAHQMLVTSAIFVQPTEVVEIFCMTHQTTESGTWHEPTTYAFIALRDWLLTNPN